LASRIREGPIGHSPPCGPRCWLIHEDNRTGSCPESLRANADDRLSLASLGRVEGRNGIVEGRDVADVRPQSSVPHPLDDLAQLGTIGLDNEVDRQAVRGPRLGRPDDGHQRSSSPDQTCRPLLDVATDDIENQIDSADVFQGVVVEVDELLRAEVERLLAVSGATGGDDVGAELSREAALNRFRSSIWDAGDSCDSGVVGTYGETQASARTCACALNCSSGGISIYSLMS
jgi:hypothetical protein